MQENLNMIPRRKRAYFSIEEGTAAVLVRKRKNLEIEMKDFWKGKEGDTIVGKARWILDSIGFCRCGVVDSAGFFFSNSRRAENKFFEVEKNLKTHRRKSDMRQLYPNPVFIALLLPIIVRKKVCRNCSKLLPDNKTECLTLITLNFEYVTLIKKGGKGHMKVCCVLGAMSPCDRNSMMT